MLSKNQRPRDSLRLAMALMTTCLCGGYLWAGAASAKDLYVSPSGNDGVTYAANSISTPWKTFDHGLYNLKAGDHLYVRAGTYTPQYPVWLGSDYSRQTKGGDPKEVLTSESGTSSKPVIIESYPGEQPVIDLAGVTAGNGSYINLDNKSYWTFRGLTFKNSQIVFVVGEDSPSTNNTFDNLKITANRGGDNAAGVHLWSVRADYATIRNCVIKGPGQNVHQNTGTIYVTGANHLKVLNNVLSDAPVGIYFKHRNEATSASQVDVEIAYNYITNTSRASLEYNGNFTHIHDNIFGAGTAAVHFGDANGGAGADYNTVEHNTFLSGSVALDSAIESGDPFPGVVGNTFVDNIFQKPLEVLEYSSKSNTNSFGKNLYATASAIVSFNNLVKIIAGSLIGTPKYVGGAAPTSVDGFLLASGSLGKNSATDGTDVGADVDKFQPSKGPRSPTDVAVM